MSAATITVTLNGEPRKVPAGLTLGTLLVHLQLRPELVAVELNGDIVARDRFAACAVPPDAVLEIVHFVGGG